ncbi:Kinetochore complex Fta4 of Sim4 subunit, or CENP-50 domain containing protein [Naviculisporaceae sp. PSN 640]
MPRQSTAPPTIVSLKQQWLSTQTRLLSTDLAPSKNWRAANEEDRNNRSEEGRPLGLPDKAVDDAIWAVNHRVQQHAKRVYSRQATRHVAEQIDQLYWDASNRAFDRANGEGDENENGEDEDEFRGLSYGADLVDPKIVSSLPATWTYDATSTRQSEAYPAEATQYSELVSQLKFLSSQKAEITARVTRLRRMKALLEPFDTSTTALDDPGKNDGKEAQEQTNIKLQDNLITRNGEIEKELQRMRMLLARVGGRVDQLQQKGQHQQEKGKGKGKRKRNEAGDQSQAGGQSEDESRMTIDSGLDERKKLDDLLKGF